MWLCIAAFLVFFMQAGFAFVEAGFCRAKNTVNLMMKNLMDFCIGSLAFLAVGFAFMFGSSAGGIIGTDGFFLTKYALTPAGTPDGWVFAFLIFQTVFCATAATIVSGAMAERTKFKSYLLYSLFISAIIYPIFGHWAWGSLFGGSPGWLENLGFIDFAGSSVVHSVGGWIGLAGAIVLGARIGKYDKDGKPRAIPGHSIAFAALGVFILWLGWFGFNPGSTGSVDGSIAVIAVNTNLAAAAGACVALFFSWWRSGKPDAGMALNGVLAGLVAITAGCANVSPISAIIIGALAGITVVAACRFLERVGVDDPVGAVSVHGICGALGTLCVGLFAQETYGGVNGLFFGGGFAQLGWQALGVVVCFGWAFAMGFGFFKLLKATVGLRVSREEEMEGLDLVEHGAESYPDFAVNPVDGYKYASEEA
ncbi:MAG: ammonium transporter [Actinomycetota bacterium]|nr:ammonium transporter [Actinomycetota bacterium]